MLTDVADAAILNSITRSATTCLADIEPEASPDLALMQTSAVADGDDYIINGQWYRFSLLQTVGGGTNEIQRMIIAIAGLGLPR